MNLKCQLSRIARRLSVLEDTPRLGRNSDVYCARQSSGGHGFVAICVSDNGIGMSPETASRAFEPFYSARDAPSNSGIGLATVKSFTDELNGRVEIRSVLLCLSLQPGLCSGPPRIVGAWRRCMTALPHRRKVKRVNRTRRLPSGRTLLPRGHSRHWH
jgi:signal transduction histidine kinase